MRAFSDRLYVVVAFAMLAGALLLSPIDYPLHAWLRRSAESPSFPYLVALALLLLWPLVVGASIAFSARRLWRAGGRTRLVGLTTLAIAFGLALYTL